MEVKPELGVPGMIALKKTATLGNYTTPPISNCGTLCATQAEGRFFVGVCATGTDGLAACAARGLRLASEDTVGCAAASCHCCYDPDRQLPGNGLIEARPPTTPLWPVRPVLPQVPGDCGITRTCLTIVSETFLVGACQSRTGIDTAVETCAKVGGVPDLSAVGCGTTGNCVCCLDSAALCSNPPSGACSSGTCECVITQNGASCQANNIVYPYNPPPSSGGGCQENLCNSVAAQNSFQAGCCPFNC